FSLLIIFDSCKDKTSTSDATEAAASAVGQKYTTSAESAQINWNGAGPTKEHAGTINISGGELFVQDNALTSGSFSIDMNTITVTDLEGDKKADLEAHLKGTQAEGAEDFFHVTKFPTSTFDIISITPSTDSGAAFVVKGNLTMKGLANEVSIPANITTSADQVKVESLPFTIDRTKWGINYKSKNVFKEIGDKFINDEITLQINLSATPAPVQ
ncbi:MAG: YceI family protein, partial [Saprospiraceae bacterium]